MFQFSQNKQPVLISQSTVDLYDFTAMDSFVQYSHHSHMPLALLVSLSVSSK